MSNGMSINEIWFIWVRCNSNKTDENTKLKLYRELIIWLEYLEFLKSKLIFHKRNKCGAKNWNYSNLEIRKENDFTNVSFDVFWFIPSKRTPTKTIWFPVSTIKTDYLASSIKCKITY
jgi:hypothetical protein